MVLVDGSKCELKKPSECGIENMEAGELEAAMEAAMKRSGSDLEITAEEQDKFKKAFGDPEFRKMMAEYVDEISDPKYREEQNQSPRRRRGDGRLALPHLLGPPRMERDKKDATVSTFDCCFHPAAVQRANASKPFRDLLAQTAIESVEGSYERNSKGEKLERTYHVLLGVMYKTGHPQPLMVPDDHSTTQAKDVASVLNKPAPKEDKENGAANKPNKKKKRNRKKKKGGAKDEKDELDDDIDTETPPPRVLAKGKLAAKMDAASAKKQGAKEAAATAAREKAAAMDPKELAGRILEAKGIAPAAAAAAGACRRARPTSPSLKRRLPYDVDGAKGAAKFDRKQKVLNVTIPVLPGKVDPPPDESAFPGVLDVSPAPAEDPVEAFEEPPRKPKKAPSGAPGEGDGPQPLARARESERMAFAADAIKASETAADDDDDDDDGARPSTRPQGRHLQAARPRAARQQKATATVIVEAAGVTDVVTRFEGRVCHAAPRRPLAPAKFGLARRLVVPDRCRHDAADDNVVFVFAKASPAFWDAPVAELAARARRRRAAAAAAPKKKAAAKKNKKAAAALGAMAAAPAATPNAPEFRALFDID
ncbi:hypothetical protein JL721_7579 [Aureococcus anophagefferens]|nr:hypothetical protein JL721_7579 [Aureococcus anophagefferens]